MGTFTSEVDICNSALIKVGQDTITSLSDDSERARIVSTRYPLVRDDLLRSHPWKFALARVQLASTGETPLFDYSTTFQLPSDVLRVLVTDSSQISPSSDKKVTTTFGGDLAAWRVEGDKIISNESSMKLLSVKRITDVSKFPPDWGELLAIRLGLDICYRMTSDLNLVAILQQAYNVQLSMTRSYNAQESDADVITTVDWLNARL